MRLFAAVMLTAILLACGCTITDEQWDQFCPDGHCPIAKAGKAVNAAERERFARWDDLVPPPPLPPLPPMR